MQSMLRNGQNLFRLGGEERNYIEPWASGLRSVKGKPSDGKQLNQSLILYRDI
jgi:hypothetical protein